MLEDTSAPGVGSRSKMLDGEAVAIHCAHGDTVLYPVALLQVAVGTRSMEVRAAVLLGANVSELPDLLRSVLMSRLL